MLVYGLDFTSAPSVKASKAVHQKRLTLATCWLENRQLTVQEFRSLNGSQPNDFTEIKQWLETPGPWIAGLDFPFAMPAQLVKELHWPSSWDAYIDLVHGLGKQGFVDLLADYKQSKPAGQKELRRICDALAGSISPMKMYGVPVGKMFFAGAPLLRNAMISIPFLRPIQRKPIAVETYPAMVARKFIGRTPYKTDQRRLATKAMSDARTQLLRAISNTSTTNVEPTILNQYQLCVTISTKLQQQCIDDHTADQLDSVLCAIQAAWAWTQRDNRFGCPQDVDRCEGWIYDPAVKHTP